MCKFRNCTDKFGHGYHQHMPPKKLATNIGSRIHCSFTRNLKPQMMADARTIEKGWTTFLHIMQKKNHQRLAIFVAVKKKLSHGATTNGLPKTSHGKGAMHPSTKKLATTHCYTSSFPIQAHQMIADARKNAKATPSFYMLCRIITRDYT